MKTIGLTHAGHARAKNEDYFLIRCEKMPYYMLVADGMGGHAAGEVASKTAADAVMEHIENSGLRKLTESRIRQAIAYANKKLLKAIEQDGTLKGMGTTLTFAYVENDDMIVAQVGDSGAYIFNGNSVKKITKDHTYVQNLIDKGLMEKSKAADSPLRNIITRALGMQKLEVDIYNVKWKEGDFLLLCSDGLTDYMGIQKMEQVFSGGGCIEEKAREFIDYALGSGGIDNITVIIAKNETGEVL